MAEHGPFASEQEAADTRAVRQARAAWDAIVASGVRPVAGKHVPHHLRILMDACSEAGVFVEAYDLRVLTWLANYEDTTCAVIAGLVRRAYRAGLEGASNGAEAGYVVITRSPLDPRWDIDTPGLHQERETAELERDDRRAQTTATGRGELHEVAAVVRLEGEGDE